MHYHSGVGNREDLLAGARRCLEEKGWARTTIRDITAAAGGVSMAAIGYHFGSREALLTAALIEAIDEWGDQVGRTLAVQAEPGATPAAQYAAMWERIIESYASHRKLWVASIEALLQSEHSDELRAHLARGQAQGRRGLAAILLGVDETSVDEATARSLGLVQAALLAGVLTHILTDRTLNLRGEDLVKGIRALNTVVGEG